MKVAAFCIAALAAFVSNDSWAYSTATGQISTIHVNGEVPGRGLCVQMTPAMTGGAWACVLESNAKYWEIHTILLSGYKSQRNCSIFWSTIDEGGYKLIVAAECS